MIPEIIPYTLPNSLQLSVNVAKWAIDPSKAVLLIHDMQNYFLRPIPYFNTRKSLIDNSGIIRDWSIASGIPVAYTVQPGSMTGIQRGLLNDFWGSGMNSTARDREVVGELSPNENDWILTKWRYSAFFNTDLLQRMHVAGRDQLIICGVYAHLGILATAVEAFSNDIKVFIVADAIADFSHTHHLRALNYAAHSCAVILTSNEVSI